MLRAFLPPTFALLNTSAASPVASNNNSHLISLKNHPDTVDDFFRLNARFLQRAALPYLQSDFVASIIECGLVAINLDHKDANGSVMKYIFDMMHMGRSKEERDDFEVRSAIIHRFRLEVGPRLVDGLVKAAVFYLPSYTFHDIGDVLMELMLLDRTPVCHWLEASLKGLPQESQGPAQKVTHAQLVKFHKAVTSAEEPSHVTDAIREFSRLWR
jgi:transportin-3